jgi:hypothetical protein
MTTDVLYWRQVWEWGIFKKGEGKRTLYSEGMSVSCYLSHEVFYMNCLRLFTYKDRL